METRNLLVLLCANLFIFVGYSQVNKNKLIEGVQKVLFMWAFAKRPYITYYKSC